MSEKKKSEKNLEKKAIKEAKKEAKKEAAKQKREPKGPKKLGGLLFAKMALGGVAQLRSHADEVNKLNVFPVPDGDTGDNMRMTIESGIAAIENLDTDDLEKVMNVLSHGMLLGARGNSGVILSQFFAGTAKGFKDAEYADPETLGKALEMGVEQAYGSVMTPTEGTILTVAREAVEYAVKNITPKSTIRSLFADLVKEMHASLDRTPEILEVLREAGVVDSGGAGLFYIMDGFNRVLNGEEISDDSYSTPAASKLSVAKSSFGPDSKMTYGYCTELLVQLMRDKCDVDSFDIEPLKAFLASIGDSVVAFKQDTVVKLHVHTLTPEKVLEYCRTFGEFITVKIENMSVQHTENEAQQTENTKVQKAPAKDKKKYGIVAVTNGEGLGALFKEFGTDEIVEGGQTQNPSTNDFLDAFAKVNAENIFVLPNNSNILLAAGQAADLYKDAAVYVIPSKNVGTGYAALSSMMLEGEPESILNDANAAMERVTAGYISPSIRDADLNGIHINEGDTIGIVNKEIVVANADRMTASLSLAKTLLSDERFMLTVFCGKDAPKDEQDALKAAIESENPSAEVYFIDGGQDIYPYILLAE